LNHVASICNIKSTVRHVPFLAGAASKTSLHARLMLSDVNLSFFHYPFGALTEISERGGTGGSSGRAACCLFPQPGLVLGPEPGPINLLSPSASRFSSRYPQTPEVDASDPEFNGSNGSNGSWIMDHAELSKCWRHLLASISTIIDLVHCLLKRYARIMDAPSPVAHGLARPSCDSELSLGSSRSRGCR
jgi:hypothetical protein